LSSTVFLISLIEDILKQATKPKEFLNKEVFIAENLSHSKNVLNSMLQCLVRIHKQSQDSPLVQFDKVMEQTIQKCLTASVISYEVIFSKFLRLYGVFSYYMDSKECKISTFEGIIFEPLVDYLYAHPQLFSEISFRQPSQILVALMGCMHEDVLNISSQFSKEQSLIPVQCMAKLAEDLQEICEEIEKGTLCQIESSEGMFGSH